MSAYIDGIVTPLPKRHLAAYRRLSRSFGKVWREHGAIEYQECIADDVSWGKRTSFPRSVNPKAGRWCAWPGSSTDPGSTAIGCMPGP